MVGGCTTRHSAAWTPRPSLIRCSTPVLLAMASAADSLSSLYSIPSVSPSSPSDDPPSYEQSCNHKPPLSSACKEGRLIELPVFCKHASHLESISTTPRPTSTRFPPSVLRNSAERRTVLDDSDPLKTPSRTVHPSRLIATRSKISMPLSMEAFTTQIQRRHSSMALAASSPLSASFCVAPDKVSGRRVFEDAQVTREAGADDVEMILQPPDTNKSRLGPGLISTFNTHFIHSLSPSTSIKKPASSIYSPPRTPTSSPLTTASRLRAVHDTFSMHTPRPRVAGHSRDRSISIPAMSPFLFGKDPAHPSHSSLISRPRRLPGLQPHTPLRPPPLKPELGHTPVFLTCDMNKRSSASGSAFLNLDMKNCGDGSEGEQYTD
jgi:hypothetical protein